MATWEAILPDITDKVFQGIDRPRKLTATNGSTTTFVAASQAHTSTSAYAYDGVGILILDTTDDAAPKGEFSRVTKGGFAGASGTFTVAPVWTAPANGDTGLLFYGGFTYQDFLDAANTVIQSHYWPRWLPLSLCPDGDMEDDDTDASDFWSDIGTVTLTKDTVAATTLLRRALKIVTSSQADGTGARSNAFTVHEGETLHVSVAVKCVAGRVRVELYDADAAAVISGETYETDEYGYVDVRFQYAVDTDVERIQVQIVQDGTDDLEVYVGYVSVLSDRRAVYDLPSAIEDASFVTSIEYLPWGVEFEDDASMLFERWMQPWNEGKPIRDYFAANPHRLQVERPYYQNPLFVRFRARDSLLTGLTSTTIAPTDVVVYGTAAELLRRWAVRLKGSAHDDKMTESMMMMRHYNSVMSSLDLDRPTVDETPLERVRVP